jgi:hypothetical protein
MAGRVARFGPNGTYHSSRRPFFEPFAKVRQGGGLAFRPNLYVAAFQVTNPSGQP